MAFSTPKGNTFVRQTLKNLIKKIAPKRFILWEDRSKKMTVALTFDDGPHPDYTPKILDILKLHRVKATFFVVGSNAERYPNIVKRIQSEGHEVGNHGYSYNFKEKRHAFAYRSSSIFFNDEQVNEIKRTNAILNKLLPIDDIKLYRPPYGKIQFKSFLYCLSHRFTICLWSIDPKDFKVKNKEKIIESCAHRKCLDGQIVLLHDNNPFTLESLPDIIARFNEKGCSFAPAGYLLR